MSFLSCLFSVGPSIFWELFRRAAPRVLMIDFFVTPRRFGVRASLFLAARVQLGGYCQQPHVTRECLGPLFPPAPIAIAAFTCSLLSSSLKKKNSSHPLVFAITNNPPNKILIRSQQISKIFKANY
jgi:hypothetical protein